MNQQQRDNNEVKARDIQSRVLSLEKNVRSELDRIKVEKKNLTDFVAQKSAELSQIVQNLNVSNNNSQQISTLLNQSIGLLGYYSEPRTFHHRLHLVHIHPLHDLLFYVHTPMSQPYYKYCIHRYKKLNPFQHQIQ